MGYQLRKITIQNYMSLREMSLSITPGVNVFVGKNGSGKSNIFKALKFMRRAGQNLAEAISEYGGTKELTWRKLGDGPISVTFLHDVDDETRTGIVTDIVYDNVEKAISGPLFRHYFLRLEVEGGRGSISLHTDTTPNGIPSLLVQREVDTDGRSSQKLIHRFYDRGDTYGPEYVSAETSGNERGLFLTKTNPIASTRVGHLVLDFQRVIADYGFLSPIRRSQPTALIQTEGDLAPEAENLVALLKTLEGNNKAVFNKIQVTARKLVPLLGEFSMPLHGGAPANTTLGCQDPSWPNALYYFRDLSYGTQSLLAIITKLCLMSPGEMVCIEEPEAHLHPGLVSELYGFLSHCAREGNLFVFLTTHSPVIASLSRIGTIYLTTNKGGETVIESVTEENVAEIISELGLKPSHGLEADAVVIVEGKEDIPVYEAWAKKLGVYDKMRFIPAGGWTSVNYYANADWLRGLKNPPRIYVIFDGDTDAEKFRTVKQKVIERLGKIAGVFTLSESETEGYLLDPDAILSAFPEIGLSRDQLDCELSPLRRKRDPKGGLDELFLSHMRKHYNGKLGALIAQACGRVPTEIADILTKIRDAAQT
jgi:predicted ATPase